MYFKVCQFSTGEKNAKNMRIEYHNTTHNKHDSGREQYYISWKNEEVISRNVLRGYEYIKQEKRNGVGVGTK